MIVSQREHEGKVPRVMNVRRESIGTSLCVDKRDLFVKTKRLRSDPIYVE